MANRHLSRSVVLQTLFEGDFNNLGEAEIKAAFKRNAEEFAPGLEDASFAERLLSGTLEQKFKIDKIIEKAAPEWPLSQVAIVDRNVLRLGLYELLFSNRRETPPKVAINESIELAKGFGGESSGRFVNGVLGTVYKEIFPDGEPLEILPEEKLGGAVVYRKDGGEIYFALVHDVFGYWTVSKGHIVEGEDVKDGVKRELMEEIGLNIKIEEELGVNEYTAADPEKGKIKKIVSYFLASTKDGEIKLKDSGGLDDARWFKMEELADLTMYDDMRPIVAKAVKMVTK